MRYIPIVCTVGKVSRQLKRLGALLLPVLLMLVVVASPVLAYTYATLIQVIETGSNAYDELAITASIDNEYLAANGFIETDGLDTRVLAGGTAQPHMVANDRTNFCDDIGADTTNNFYYTWGNDDLTNLYVIPGYDGYVTIPDDDTIELGNYFEVEQYGYIDIEPSFPSVVAVNGGNDVVNQNNHTVNLPSGIVAGDLLLVLFASDGNPNITFPNEGTDWIQLFEDVNGISVKFGAWYRIADGTEGATITVATSAIEMTAHTSYRITDYAGVPEVETSVTGESVNPNPPSLSPSWGARYTLWFAVTGHNNLTAVRTITDYPANYADGRNDYADDVEGAGVGVARRELLAVNEDPGTFTIEGVTKWVANTVAIDGSRCLVRKADAFETYVNASGEITSTISGGGSVTATGLTSGEYTVTTTGGFHEALGDVLHFDGGANSIVDCTNIGNGAKFWVSLWFKLDNDFSAGTPDQYIFGKYQIGTNFLIMFLSAADGKLKWWHRDLGADRFTIVSGETSWSAGQWYHVMVSLGQAIGGGAASNGARLRIDNGGALTNANATALNNTGKFLIGDQIIGSTTGLKGVVANVVWGNDDLTVVEETALYNGTAPGDAIDYWYIDEGTGTNIISYGAAPTNGTADLGGCTWLSQSRPVWLDIAINTVVKDSHAREITVPPNGNAYTIMGNNVIPYLDYMTIDKNGVEVLRYEPITIIVGTTLPDETGNNDGTFTWGADPAGVTTTVFNAVPYAVGVGETGEIPAQEILPEQSFDIWGLGTNPSNMFSAIVDGVAGMVVVPPLILWILLAAFVLMIVTAFSFAFFNHTLITGLLQLMVIGLFLQMGILSYWILVLTIVAVIALVLYERVPSV